MKLNQYGSEVVMNKYFFSIKEVGEILNVSPSTLRYYDGMKLIDIKRNSKNGYREYSISDVYKLHQIIEARQLEIPIKEIEKLFTNPNENVYFALVADRARFLEKEINRLKKLLQSLNYSIDIYKTSLETIGKLEFNFFQPRKMKHIGTINKIEKYDNINFIDNMELYSLDFSLEETLYFCKDSNSDSFDLFLADDEKFDAVFPAGIYCTTAIKGDFYTITNKLSKIINDLESQGYNATGKAIQLVLPEHLLFTSSEDALVRIQIPVNKKYSGD